MIIILSTNTYIFLPFILIVFVFVFIKIINLFKIYHIIKDTPTSKIRSVAMGFSEIYGKIISNNCLITPISKKPCVYYDYKKEVFTQTQKSSSWNTVEKKQEAGDFVLEDDTGQIIVKNKDARYFIDIKSAYYYKPTIKLKDIKNQLKVATSKKESEEYILKNLETLEINNGTPKYPLYRSSGDIRIIERYISKENNVYVIGTVCSSEDNKNIIKKGEHEKTFVISDKSEDVLIKYFKKKISVLFITISILLIMSVCFLIWW
jgi:hypothetical protein